MTREPGPSATAAAYEQLRELIVSGRLEPGGELREAALAGSTGFGRTPVREALRRLVQEGLVEVRPRQGYRVAPVTVGRVHELFEMRLLLEPAAVELAVRRAPRAALQALHPLAHATYAPDDAEDHRRFLVANREFHAGIARAAGNSILAGTLGLLLAEMQRLFLLASAARPGPEPVHEHHGLFDALVDGDAERARALVVEQIERSRERVLRALVAADPPPTTAAIVLSGRA